MKGVHIAIVTIGAVLIAGLVVFYLPSPAEPESDTSPETSFNPIQRVDADDLNQQGIDIEESLCGTKFSDDGKTEVCEPRTLLGRNLLWIPDDVTIDSERAAQLIHAKVNSYREENGLKTLEYQTELADIATAHAQDMAKYRYFSHINRNNQTPTERGESAGYECASSDGIFIYSGIGENLAYTFVHEQPVTFVSGVPIPKWITDENTIADNIFQLWKTSPGHNANLLDPNYEYEGLGIMLNEHGEIFSVQNFAVCEP
jgi:uncharacterized protein YkwD